MFVASSFFTETLVASRSPIPEPLVEIWENASNKIAGPETKLSTENTHLKLGTSKISSLPLS